MKVFIYATEGIYQGLHGIFDQQVTEINDIEEGDMLGHEMAEGLISSFGLEDEYYDEDGEYIMDPEFDYVIYPIADEYISMSDEELDNIAYREGYETFIEEYCGEELLS